MEAYRWSRRRGLASRCPMSHAPLMSKKPFASVSISVGDSNNDGKTDLVAILDIGPLHLQTPPLSVDVLDAITIIREAFGLANGLKK